MARIVRVALGAFVALVLCSTFASSSNANVMMFDGATVSSFDAPASSAYIDVTEWSGYVGWYSSAKSTIERKYWDGTGATQTLVAGVTNLADFAIGHTNYAYWIDKSTNSILVWNGISIAPFVTGLLNPSGIQWDAWSGYVTWLDNGKIQRKYWDGTSGIETLVDGLNGVTEYATGHTNYAYWIDRQARSIKQWNGSTISDFVVGLSDPRLIQWNAWTGYVDWFDAGSDSFQRRFWDGTSGTETLLSNVGSVESFDTGPMSYVFWIPQSDASSVPEPATLALLFVGLASLARKRRMTGITNIRA